MRSLSTSHLPFFLDCMGDPVLIGYQRCVKTISSLLSRPRRFCTRSTGGSSLCCGTTSPPFSMWSTAISGLCVACCSVLLWRGLICREGYQKLGCPKYHLSRGIGNHLRPADELSLGIEVRKRKGNVKATLTSMDEFEKSTRVGSHSRHGERVQ